MTDFPTPAPQGQDPSATGQQPGIRVLAQYMRDFSFENPRAPESLRMSGPPQIELGVEMSARVRPDSLYEVELKLNVQAQDPEKQPAFQIELVYGGLFEVSGVPQEHMEPVLLVECPRHLFPFARRIIADATGEGGFPPFLMEPIDFGTVYAAQRAQGQQLEQAGQDGQPVGHA